MRVRLKFGMYFGRFLQQKTAGYGHEKITTALHKASINCRTVTGHARPGSTTPASSFHVACNISALTLTSDTVVQNYLILASFAWKLGWTVHAQLSVAKS